MECLNVFFQTLPRFHFLSTIGTDLDDHVLMSLNMVFHFSFVLIFSATYITVPRGSDALASPGIFHHSHLTHILCYQFVEI